MNGIGRTLPGLDHKHVHQPQGGAPGVQQEPNAGPAPQQMVDGEHFTTDLRGVARHACASGLRDCLAHGAGSLAGAALCAIGGAAVVSNPIGAGVVVGAGALLSLGGTYVAARGQLAQSGGRARCLAAACLGLAGAAVQAVPVVGGSVGLAMSAVPATVALLRLGQRQVRSLLRDCCVQGMPGMAGSLPVIRRDGVEIAPNSAEHRSFDRRRLCGACLCYTGLQIASLAATGAVTEELGLETLNAAVESGGGFDRVFEAQLPSVVSGAVVEGLDGMVGSVTTALAALSTGNVVQYRPPEKNPVQLMCDSFSNKKEWLMRSCTNASARVAMGNLLATLQNLRTTFESDGSFGKESDLLTDGALLGVTEFRGQLVADYNASRGPASQSMTEGLGYDAEVDAIVPVPIRDRGIYVKPGGRHDDKYLNADFHQLVDANDSLPFESYYLLHKTQTGTLCNNLRVPNVQFTLQGRKCTVKTVDPQQGRLTVRADGPLGAPWIGKEVVENNIKLIEYEYSDRQWAAFIHRAGDRAVPPPARAGDSKEPQAPSVSARPVDSVARFFRGGPFALLPKQGGANVNCSAREEGRNVILEADRPVPGLEVFQDSENKNLYKGSAALLSNEIEQHYACVEGHKSKGSASLGTLSKHEFLGLQLLSKTYFTVRNGGAGRVVERTEGSLTILCNKQIGELNGLGKPAAHDGNWRYKGLPDPMLRALAAAGAKQVQPPQRKDSIEPSHFRRESKADASVGDADGSVSYRVDERDVDALEDVPQPPRGPVAAPPRDRRESIELAHLQRESKHVATPLAQVPAPFHARGAQAMDDNDVPPPPPQVIEVGQSVAHGGNDFYIHQESDDGQRLLLLGPRQARIGPHTATKIDSGEISGLSYGFWISRDELDAALNGS